MLSNVSVPGCIWQILFNILISKDREGNMLLFSGNTVRLKVNVTGEQASVLGFVSVKSLTEMFSFNT